MTVTDTYDIQKIIVDIEVALQIDGVDYAEKDMSVIMSNIHKRIMRQYQLDLRNTKIYDDSLFIGNSRNAAVMFVDNITMLHARLAGYFHIARFTHILKIRALNINYMGYKPETLEAIWCTLMDRDSMPNAASAIVALSNRFSHINNCIEKRLILIMLVAWNLGFDEIVAVIAEIFYTGQNV